MAGINAVPSYYPGANFVAVTPSDTVDIPNIPSDGCRLHNRGASGVVNIDGGMSGTNIQVFIPQGGCPPFTVRRVYASNLGAGVDLVACW